MRLAKTPPSSEPACLKVLELKRRIGKSLTRIWFAPSFTLKTYYWDRKLVRVIYILFCLFIHLSWKCSKQHKHKQSLHIKCKNNLFKPCVRSKQPRTIKTIICNDIFTSLRRKKVQSPAKQFKELFSLCPNHFRWNGVVVSEVEPCLFLISALDRSSKVLSWVDS